MQKDDLIRLHHIMYFEIQMAKGTLMKTLVKLLIVVAFGTAMASTPCNARAETTGGDGSAALCASVKQLVDKVATVILNNPSDEAFDDIVKSVLGEFCVMRAKTGNTPDSIAAAEEATSAIFGWAGDVTNVMKFKAQRNDSAAEIAARSMRRRVTRIQTICPTVVVPNIAGLP